MKKKNYLKNLLPALTMLLCSVVASAHDFEVDGIYYNISSDEVEVTFMGRRYSSYSNEYSGSVVIPNSITYNGKTYNVTSIEASAFRNCDSLTSITIPNSVTSIGRDAFSGCKNIEHVSLNCPTIDNWFKGFTKLKNIELGDNVTSIGEDAFSGCSGLTSVTIGNGVKNIGESAFSGCTGLTSITIPNSVTSIGNNAFYGCKGIKTVVNFSGLKFIKSSFNNGYIAYYADKVINAYNGSVEGYYAFEKADGINTLCGYIGNATDIILPVNYKGESYVIGDRAFYDYTDLTSIIIPNSVTSIGESAFERCIGLTSITIPNSVTNIGSYAFSGCIGLTSITIPNSVTNIGDRAFCDCINLTSITIPNSVTNIGDRAFRGCTGLTNIIIPNSVTSIGYMVLDGCTGITSVIVESGNSKYDSRNNCNAIIETATNTLIFGCINTKFPYDITKIEQWAFCGGCNSNIIIPANIKYIGGYAFMSCPITSLTISDGVETIKEGAFAGCSGLTNVTIPKSVTKIDSIAFAECTNLTHFVVEKGNSVYDSRDNCNAIIETATNTLISGCKNTVIPNSVTNIGNRAFMYCFDLTSIEIPESVTSIERGAFADCYNLANVTLGNNVTSIGEGAFSGCVSLKSITIPERMTKIEGYAFWQCNLNSIYLLCKTPPVLNNDGLDFISLNYNGTTLYVPQGSLEAYKSAVGWNEFNYIVEFDPTGIEDVTKDVAPAFEVTAGGIKFTDAEGKAVAVYSTVGAVLEKIDSYAGEEITLDRGVYIVRVGNKTVKVSL